MTGRPGSGSVLSTRAKSEGYYANDRADVVAALSRPLGQVLDVGCGAGAAAAALRAAGAERIVGIEPYPEAAARARERYDEVLAGTVEAVAPGLRASFQTILCLDVLEHLVDPEAVLLALRELGAPSARLAVSVPNARHFSLAWDLVVRGTFGYAEWGHRDSTHLRWFTQRDIVALLTTTGWEVERTSHPVSTRGRLAGALTRGRSSEFLAGQWHVFARRSER